MWIVTHFAAFLAGVVFSKVVWNLIKALEKDSEDV